MKSLKMRSWIGLVLVGFLGIVFSAGAEASDTYMIIDLSEGPAATNYPVSYTNVPPDGGWTDEYKTTKLVLRWIPAGTFTMGSPTNELGRYEEDDREAQRSVTLTQDFYMGVFQVTQKQWERVMGNWPSWFANTTYRDSRPVDTVCYFDIRENPERSAITPNWPESSQVHAESFMGKLRAKTELMTLDLPTEAQWERACRAGTTTALNSGKNLTDTVLCPNMDEVGRHYYNHPGGYSYSSSVSTDGGTAKVGSYLPNAWGLYDMHGNVWEWCLDRYEEYHAEQTDPVGAISGGDRVLRSGSLGNGALASRSAFRFHIYPGYRHTGRYGFRLSTSEYRTLTVVGGSGGRAYTAGTAVAVTADAAQAGQIFNDWLVDPAAADLGEGFDPAAASTTVIMPAYAVTLTAQWMPHPYPSDDVVVENRRELFYWLSVEGATWYQLWIQHDGQKYLEQWVEGATTWTPPSNGLPGGNYQWWVRGWGPEIGYTAWSSAAIFSIVASPPGALTQTAPSGVQVGNDLTFRWEKDTNATWYRLWVSRPSGGTWHDRWYGMSGTGEGTATVNGHPGGTSSWWMRPWGPDGFGPWAGPQSFSTPDPAPAVPTLVSPVGQTSSPVTLQYESERAEWYRVYVTRGGTVVLDRWTQGTTYDMGARPSGSYSWWVAAWNAASGRTVWSARGEFAIPQDPL